MCVLQCSTYIKIKILHYCFQTNELDEVYGQLKELGIQIQPPDETGAKEKSVGDDDSYEYDDGSDDEWSDYDTW
jgi:hypothetical protein